MSLNTKPACLWNPAPWLFAVLCAAFGLVQAPGPASAAPRADFPLGMNAEQQQCRATLRFSGAADPPNIDVYCAEWPSPSGELRLAKRSDVAASRAFSDACPGEIKQISASGDVTLGQVLCRRPPDDPAKKYGLVLVRGKDVVYGDMYPADWGPGLRAARVLIGLDKPDKTLAQDVVPPGLAEIRSAFPGGPPGASAIDSYQTKKLAAYAENVLWNFDAAERLFEELLEQHHKVLPDDVAGEGQILAEMAVDLSAAGRQQEAQAALDRAEADARKANDRALLEKLVNYRALAALDRHDWTRALELATLANRMRADHGGSKVAARDPLRINRDEADQLEREAPQARPRVLVNELSEASDAEKAEVLSAQADYISAIALRRLGRPGVAQALASAEAHLANTDTRPAWLSAAIAEERARVAMSQRDFAGAIKFVQSGAAVIRELAPYSRAEGHLLFALADAQAAAGRGQDALESGRRAVKIYAQQTETPGFPANVAAAHLQRILNAWKGASAAEPRAALADEYVSTLSLVWDGSAARAMTQMAARLGDQEGSRKVVRDYQDALRALRKAVAKQALLTADQEPTPEAVASVAAEVKSTGDALARAEAAVRSSNPRYLELLSPRIDTRALRKALEPHEAYVRIVLTDGQGFGAFVTHDQVRPYAIALTMADAEHLVGRVRDSVKLHGRRLPDYDLDAAAKLYKALLGPVETDLAGAGTLHIDTGPALSALPFAALVVRKPAPDELRRISSTHDYRGVAWLARDHPIDVALGSAAFLRVRTSHRPAPTTPVVAFGGFQPDPSGVAARLTSRHRISESCQAPTTTALAQLQALPASVEEAKAISASLAGASGRVVTGPDFTDAAVLKDKQVGGAEVVIIATHGVLGLTDCLNEPALLTSLGPDGDGLLEASRVLDLTLSAKLVILSACDTAGGGGANTAATGLVDGGEALSGLARSFIYSGGADVLATEWPVSDEAARLETKTLIDAARAGVPLVQGLAKAQAALFSDPLTGHPFFWASFVLLGDGAITLSAGPAAPKVASTVPSAPLQSPAPAPGRVKG